MWNSSKYSLMIKCPACLRRVKTGAPAFNTPEELLWLSCTQCLSKPNREWKRVNKVLKYRKCDQICYKDSDPLFFVFTFIPLCNGAFKPTEMCPSALGVLEDIGHLVCPSSSASWGGVLLLPKPPAGYSMKGCKHKREKDRFVNLRKLKQFTICL